MQLLKNIYFVSGFAYGVNANVYAVRGPEGIVLIDSGVDHEDLAIVDRTMKDWGLDESPVTHVLVTHDHLDHVGHAHELRRRGAVIVTHAGIAEEIEPGSKKVFGYAHGKSYTPCTADRRVSEGNRLVARRPHVPGRTSRNTGMS
jgi:hydroxyacylglutathione hydrolase